MDHICIRAGLNASDIADPGFFPTEQQNKIFLETMQGPALHVVNAGLGLVWFQRAPPRC
ncbi:MAG: hypothetical protein QOF83_13 [Solirubrobacteraceae bacterium]|jgi:hypothetical protein|nr:hypothetical protein [Solirubrobacteraceae bacterium]